MVQNVMIKQHQYDVKLREAAQLATAEFEKAKDD
jgi:hypothetical protein